ISRSIARGAFSTTNSTVARLLRPAPAIIVSSIWLSNVSPGSSTAAIPPWAWAVEPSLSAPLAMTPTLNRPARLSAAVSPAAPEPMTRTSKRRSTIGPGRAGEIEEHVLEIRLAGRDVDHAESLALDGGEHLAGVGAVLAIGDDEHPIALELDLVEDPRVGCMGDVAVDDDLDHLLLRLRDQRLRRVVRDHLAVIDDRDPVAKFLGLLEIVGGEHHGDALRMERAHIIPQLLAQLDVDAGGRLV